MTLRFAAASSALALSLVLSGAAYAQQDGEPAVSVAQVLRPALVMDVASGNVMHAVDAHAPWHPASLTKMMTIYVAFRAVQQGRLGMQSMLRVSPLAARQAPSKMGYRAGTEVSLEAAIMMLMVKSANDISVTVAEGVSGSLEAFVAEMNAHAQALGMNSTVWRNANGLHHPEQVTSARDMALLARSLIVDFPQYQGFYRQPAITAGRRTMRNFNALIGRYAGADGMKTGFICASGFNLVGSATRDGRRHVAVVFGAPNARARAERAADLLERSFAFGASPFGRDLPNIRVLPRPLETPSVAPNMRSEVCGPNRRRGSESEDVEDATAFTGSAGGLFAFLDGGNAQGRPGEPRLAPRTPQMTQGVDANGNPTMVRASLLMPVQGAVRSLVMEQSAANQRQQVPSRVRVASAAPADPGQGARPAAAAAAAVGAAGAAAAARRTNPGAIPRQPTAGTPTNLTPPGAIRPRPPAGQNATRTAPAAAPAQTRPAQARPAQARPAQARPAQARPARPAAQQAPRTQAPAPLPPLRPTRSDG